MEPTIDPITGKSVQPTPPADPSDPTAPLVDPSEMMTVPKGEWDNMKTRLDSFEKGINFGRQTAQPAAAPAVPAGPTLSDQLAEIDTQITALDTQVDAAVADGKPVSKLLKERDTLTSKRLRMQIKAEDIDPAFNAGIQTIDQLSEEITKGQMSYLTIPEVKAEYDNALASLTPDQKMNPKMRMVAYQIAVGKPENLTKILEAQKEATLREASQPPTDPPAGNSRGTGGGDGGDTVPKPKDVLSRDALAAINSKGITVDEYYKKLGYNDWADFWEKRGKSYFGEEEE